MRQVTQRSSSRSSVVEKTVPLSPARRVHTSKMTTEVVLDEIAVEDIGIKFGSDGNEINATRNPSAEELVDDIDLSVAGTSAYEEIRGGNSGIFGAGFNFVNSILGAGIIGLPFAVKECGLGLGILMLLLVNALTYMAVQTLIKCGVATNRRGFESLVEYCFGRCGYILICAFMFSFAFGAMCAYLIIIGDTVPPVLRNMFGGSEISRNLVISVFSIVIILPLALMKDMAKLSWSSLLSVLADVVIVLIVMVRAPARAAEIEPPIEADYSFGKPTFFAGVGAMSFAFVCQHSSFIVFNTLQVPTVKNWRYVSVTSLTVVGILSMMLSLSGYLAFFNETDPNILNNFSNSNDPAVDIARFCLALTMVFTYPMELFVARHAFHNVFWGDMPNVPMPDKRHYIITLVFWALSLIIGLTVTNLGVVLELVGSFSGSMIGYILPAACYLKVRQKDKKALMAVYQGSNQRMDDSFDGVSASSYFDFHLLAIYFMLVFGFVAMILGSILAIQNAE